MSESLDLWYVKLPNGDVHRVTLDQLDGAFQGGRIDGRTMVMPAESSEPTAWTSLSQLLGLEDEPAVPAVQAPPPPTVVAAQAVAPYSYAPVASVAPAAVSTTPPPVTYARVQPVANSLRPMSFDLGNDDLADVPFQRKSRKGWAVAIVALAAAAGIAGFVSTHPRSSGDDIATVAAAAAMAVPQSYAAAPLPPPSPAWVPVVPPVAVAGQSAAPAEASPLNPQFTDRFNQTTKQKLLDADKARDDKAKARHSAASAYRPAHSSKASNVFTSGGNKYDPLNSNL